MIVELHDVSKTTHVKGRPYALFDGLSLQIEEGEHVGILGLPRSGKTTLLRILGGGESVDNGWVQNNATASWLIPQIGFLSATATLAWNIRWLGRMYGIKGDLARDVGELAGISKWLNRRTRECPRDVRQLLGVYLPLAMPFGLYLFDGGPVTGRKEEREAAAALFMQRTKGKTIVIAAEATPPVDGLCDSIYVLENGRARSFASSDEALEYFKQLLKTEKGRKKSTEEVPEDEESLEMSDEADTMDQVAVAASDF